MNERMKGYQDRKYSAGEVCVIVGITAVEFKDALVHIHSKEPEEYTFAELKEIYLYTQMLKSNVGKHLASIAAYLMREGNNRVPIKGSMFVDLEEEYFLQEIGFEIAHADRVRQGAKNTVTEEMRA